MAVPGDPLESHAGLPVELCERNMRRDFDTDTVYFDQNVDTP